MRIYLVGGALRDELLRLPVTERDWVVVGASRDDMLNLGYRPVEGDFPVFLHPETGEEYALARRERKTGAGHRGFVVETGADVTLEQDLMRRDLTINAMARDEDGTIIDPYGGRDDLDEGRLRHVSDAFVEDPLRLLRAARFAAKLGRWDFRLAHGTHSLLKRMAASGELATLSRERIWRETAKALATDTPSRYFDLLRRCGALHELFPELLTLLGEIEGHGVEHDPARAALRRLDEAATLGYEPALRLAVLLAYGGATDAERLLRRLSPGRADADGVRLYHRCAATAAGVHDGETLLGLIECCDALRRPGRLEALLRLCRLGPPAMDEGLTRRLREAAAAVREVQADRWLAQGLEGRALGTALRAARLDTAGRFF